MTPQEETERATQAAAGMADFMGKLNEAIEQHQRGQKDPGEKWDEHDYEKFMKECDARTDKYGELLDKYGDSDEAMRRIEREMGWDRHEEVNDDGRMSIEEMNAICDAAENEPPPEPDPRRAGIDWIRTENGDIKHPLQHRSFEGSVRFFKQARKLGLEALQD
jgi:hypothetical protein